MECDVPLDDLSITVSACKNIEDVRRSLRNERCRVRAAAREIIQRMGPNQRADFRLKFVSNLELELPKGGTRVEAAERGRTHGWGMCLPALGPELCMSPLLWYLPLRARFHLMMEPISDCYGIQRILSVGRGFFFRVLDAVEDNPRRRLPPDFQWIFILP